MRKTGDIMVTNSSKYEWRIVGTQAMLVVAAWVIVGLSVWAHAQNGPPPPPPPSDASEAAQTEHFERMMLDDNKRPPHGRRRSGRDLSQEDLDQVIVILEKIKPEAADQVRTIREKKGEQAGRVVAREFPRVMMFLEMRKRNPDMFDLRLEDMELNRQSRRLAEAFRDARETGELDQAAALKRKLVANVKQHFLIREQIRERELASLEQRIESLRDELAERKKLENRIIQDRVHELTGDDDTQW